MPSFPLIYFHRPSTACGAFDFRVRRRPVSPDCSHPSFSSTCHTQLCTCLLTVVVVVVVQVYARLVHLLQYMHVDNFPSLMFYDDGCGLRKFAGAPGGRRFPRHCNDHPPRSAFTSQTYEMELEKMAFRPGFGKRSAKTYTSIGIFCCDCCFYLGRNCALPLVVSPECTGKTTRRLNKPGTVKNTVTRTPLEMSTAR